MPTFVVTENLCSIWILLDVFNDIDEIGNLGEERIIVWKIVTLFAVVARLSDIKDRLNIRID
jgi:hypothetical protein